MPGANYMGGKRNTMKLRSKDTVGRQQKGFFGRQRLDLLSKGLCASNASEVPKIATLLSSRGAENIDLAHARQKIPVDDVSLRSYIPSPIRVSPSTPRSRKRTRKEAHTSSSGSRYSKAIEALDTLEPSSLRRTLDKILATPDLACLGSWRRRDLGARVGLADSDDENPDPRTKIPLRESPFLNRYSRTTEVPCTPPRKRISSNGYNWQQAVLPSTDKSTSPFHKFSDGKSCSADDASVRDSGFWEVDPYPSHSSPWSTQRRPSSSPGSEYEDSVEEADWESLVDANSNERRFGVSRSRSPASIQDAMPQNLFGEANLPSYIKLGPEKCVSAGYAAKDEEERTVYGSLFEQVDPWTTVGAILKLPGIISSENSWRPSPLPADCNSQRKNNDFGSTVPQTGIRELWEDELNYDEDFDSLFDGTWRATSPPNFIEMDVDPIPTPSPRERTNVASPSRSFVEHSGDADAGDHDIQTVHINQSPIQKESGEQPTATLCVGPGDSDELMEMSGDSEDESSVRKSVARCFKTPEDRRDQDEPDLPEIFDVDDDIHDQSEHGNDGGREFDVPCLREVDGRFVGPTLFNDFEDSEEE